jgi:hypothetical protein
MTTVIPANTTAPPAVAAARAIDSRIQLQLVAGDDEQRVVDPDAEADHRRKRGGDAGHVDDVTEQLDDCQ